MVSARRGIIKLFCFIFFLCLISMLSVMPTWKGCKVLYLYLDILGIMIIENPLCSKKRLQ